ncbi:MAG: Crp/Fnr family transcriptional regulator [Bdellovibrionota bacterium]
MASFDPSILIQFAYVLTLASFCVRNFTVLRCFAIAASIATIFYAASFKEATLWVPILWNTLFICANVLQLSLARWKNRGAKLNPLETFLAKTALESFPPSEIKSFVRVASEGELAVGQPLIRSGTQLSHLFCILQGEADITLNSTKLDRFGPGKFLGEMSLLTQSLTRADVTAATNMKLLVWPHNEIEKWVGSDSSRLGLLQTALGRQVVEALLKQQATKSTPQAESA